MRRLLGRIFPGLLLLLLVPGAGARAHDGHSHTIEGRLEPELLPETSVWEHAFYAIHSLTGGRRDPRDPEVYSFIGGNVFLSDADTTILLEEVAATRAQIRRLEIQLADVARAGDRPDEEAALKHQLLYAPVVARDRTLARLSFRGRKALLRWVAIITQGMSHGPNR